HHLGGPTIRGNLACLCRRHHQIKQLPGWTITQGEHGQLSFTTPTRRIYRTRPPNPDGTEEPTETL
ncbi:MAG TPA: HNH endonuclease, partial [Sporichthyaceae bacterium]